MMLFYFWTFSFFFVLTASGTRLVGENQNAPAGQNLTSFASVDNGTLLLNNSKINETLGADVEEELRNGTFKQNSSLPTNIYQFNETSTTSVGSLLGAQGMSNTTEHNNSNMVSDLPFPRDHTNKIDPADPDEHSNDTVVADDPATGKSDQHSGLNKVQSNLIILSCVLSIGILLTLFQVMRGRKRRRALRRQQQASSPGSGGASPARKVWDYPGPPSFKEVINVPSSSQAENDIGELNALATEVINRELLKENRIEALSPQVSYKEKPAPTTAAKKSPSKKKPQ